MIQYGFVLVGRDLQTFTECLRGSVGRGQNLLPVVLRLGRRSRYDTHFVILPYSVEVEMANYSTNEFKSGLKVMLDGEPCSIMDNEYVKPGKGQAFNRVKLRNLRNGRVVEKTFKSGDSLEGADVMEIDMEYLYDDGEFWHFMATDGSFEQHGASKDAVGETLKWLKEQDVYVVTLFNGAVLTVTPPNFVELEVTETDPGVKGDTAQGGSKPATLTTGAVVKVPLFVNIGDKLRIDTRTGDYVSRV